jgi:preprotein translocase subunit SecD
LIRTVAALLLSAAPVAAEVPLLAFAALDETLTVPQGTPVAAEATLDLNGTPAVYLQLPEPKATGFARLTERSVGQIITINLCGQTVSAPRLLTPIPGGAIVLPGEAVAQDAARTVAILTRGTCD